MRKANKKLASAIVLGLMLAVPVGASAAEVTDPINPDVSKEYVSDKNVHIVNDGNDKSTIIIEKTRVPNSASEEDKKNPNKNYDAYITYGIYGKDNNVILSGETIKIETSSGKFSNQDDNIGEKNYTRAVWASGKKITLGSDENESVVDISAKGDSARGIITMFEDGNDSVVEINGSKLIIQAEGNDARGINAGGSDTDVVTPHRSKVDINTDVVDIDVKGSSALGVTAIGRNSSIDIAADIVDVNVTDGGVFGIHVQSNTQKAEDEVPSGAAKIDITANTINVTNTSKDGLGLSAFSNGQMNITGNLTVTAKNAIDTRGNATININTEGKHTTVLNGDIVFETPYSEKDAQNSGNLINSNVNINLSGEESSWTGKAYQEYQVKVDKGSGKYDYDYTQSVELDTPEGYNYGNVTGFEMNINNGASWNMTGNSFINNVTVENGGVINVQKDVGEFNVGIAADSDDDKGGITLNNGVINLQGESQQITVTELDGTGGTVNTNSLNNKMTIDAVHDSTSITVNGSGDIADAIYQDSAKAQKLANVVTSSGTTAADKVTTDEGIIAGRYEFDVDEHGKVDTDNVSYTKNTKNEAISNMASIGLMSWRAQNNDMNKRLGELRNSNGEHGVWARMVRGESEYGAQNVKNQYNIYQLGYDEKLSTNDNWTVGAAISYSEGNSSFENGSGEDKSTGFAVYGSYLGDNGEFVDLIAKYARLDNEFDVTGGVGSGDYSTNGYSFSAEYGKRNELANDFYFEPQVELTYGRVADVDFVTKNGAKVSQDSMDSLVGRVGFAAGKNIKNGNVYVRASYLYDFDGETNVTFSNAGASESFSEDLGGGWFEFGIGTNINLSDATYLYFDVEKTTGGEVDTNWQWNAGVRYSF